MKFLTKEQYMKHFKKMNFNNPKVVKYFREINSIILEIFLTKNLKIPRLDHNTYGLTMTLFHYYILFKGFKTINKIEVPFACIFMAIKIQFLPINIEIIKDAYISYCKEEINKNNQEISFNDKADFVKYEVELYSLLSYDLDIPTPYKCFYDKIYKKYEDIFQKNKEKIKVLIFNIINDTYNRPLCLYYHPEIILISCCILGINVLDNNNEYQKILSNYDKTENELINECISEINKIYVDIK